MSRLYLLIMRKSLIAIAVMVIHPSHHDLAQDVNNLENIVKVYLPDIGWFLPIALAFAILFKWGLVLIVISIIRRVNEALFEFKRFVSS